MIFHKIIIQSVKIFCLVVILSACSGKDSIVPTETTIDSILFSTQIISTNNPIDDSSNRSTATIDHNTYSECTSEFTIVKHDDSIKPLTVEDLLQNLSLPKQTLPQEILDHQIDGDDGANYKFSIYTILDNGCTLWIVNEYYDNENETHLLLIKFEKSTKQWNFIEIGGSGNVFGIRKGTNYYFIQRHFNPSDGAIVIIPNNFENYQTVYGYIHAVFEDDLIIFTPNIPHFAPTHPNEIALFNPSIKDSTTLLPTKPNPILWAEFRNSIEKVYIELRKDGWCVRNNYNCNADDFTRSFYNIAINNATDSIAFIAEFIGDGIYAGPFELSDGRILSIENQKVVYIFRNIHNNNLMEYRELLYENIDNIIGKDKDLNKLLEQETIDKLFIN